jgi:ribokinase
MFCGVPRVVVVGSINADLVVVAERLPGPGETVSGGRFARHGGGKGANQAVAAARLGAEVEMIGAVGADELGDAALRELEDEGIDISGVERRDDAATGVALIVVDAAGENQIAIAAGANGRVGAGHVPRLAGEGVLLLGFEVPDDAVVAAAEASGWTAILNPAPARPIPERVLDAGPILTPNATEAAQLTGEDDPEAAARALRERTGAPVLVTLGGDGALLLDADGAAQRLPAPRVEVVDTTGAGDALNGALAAELAAGRPLGEAARFAVAAAARSTTREGARGGMPRRDEVTV